MKDVKTFKEFAEANPTFNERKLRWIDQQSRVRKTPKGDEEPANPVYARFAPAFTRIGRSVYVKPDTFLAIVRGEGES